MFENMFIYRQTIADLQNSCLSYLYEYCENFFEGMTVQKITMFWHFKDNL